jgi:hypothetical protein
MIITKHGNKAKDSNWWERIDIRCNGCECIFQIERKDIHSITINHPRVIEPPAEQNVLLDCPECNRRILIRKPRQQTPPLFPKSDYNSIFEDTFGKDGYFNQLFGKFK